jgi:hypothetical protein
MTEVKKKQTVFKRKFAMVSRWLHIYVSMLSFTIVFFFSVTGITLNHADLFQGKTQTVQVKGKIKPEWVSDKDTNKINKLGVVEYIRNQFQVKGAVVDFRIEEQQIGLTFKGPGYEADAFIERVTGDFELSQTRTGFVGFINDLHKGRDTGSIWSWVIDIAAVLMVLISITGMILLLYIKKKRWAGMILFVIGSILIYIIYRIWGQ